MASAVSHNLTRPDGSRDDDDNIVVLRGVSWWQYETILAVRGDATGARISYLEGDLELMSPSATHEEIKTVLARLVETYADVMDISLYGRGSMTTKSEARERGAEPDECYVLERGREHHDLVIEVVFKSGGLNKLELYRGLEAREVWFWIKGGLQIFVLEDDRYSKQPSSRAFPKLDVALLEQHVRMDDQADAVRSYRRALLKA